MTRRLAVLLGLIALVTPASPAREPHPPRPGWQVIEGCALIDSEYHDGDSFTVRAGTNAFVVRLYGADALETDTRFPERLDEQAAAFPGLTREGVLRLGEAARAHTVALLMSGPFRVLTRFEPAPGAGASQRFYAHVIARRTHLAVDLVSRGLARVHGRIPDGPGQFDAGRLRDRLLAAAEQARAGRRGAWDAHPQAARPSPRRVDLNTASRSEIAALPGIGDVLAARIMAARPFTSMDDLRKIQGLGPRRLDDLQRLAEVRPRRRPPPR